MIHNLKVLTTFYKHGTSHSLLSKNKITYIHYTQDHNLVLPYKQAFPNFIQLKPSSELILSNRIHSFLLIEYTLCVC